MEFSEKKILSLAPDPGTAQRAKTVAHAQRWHRLEGNGRAIWGECGDPASPYRVKADLTGGLAAACTCPVKRQPCKHGIGLMLLFAKANDAFRLVEEPPDWVAAWLKKRDGRAAAAEVAGAAQRSPEVEQANAEQRRLNREKRLHQMSGGLAELENWLADLFRQGLATLEGQAPGYFGELAARLADAKLSGIARRMRRLPFLVGQEAWHEKVLAELGDLSLLAQAFHRMEQLPESLQDDLLSLAGVNFKKEEVLASEGVSDRWLVAGQTLSEEENLLARRTWLLGGQSGRTGLLLEFSFGGNPFEATWRLGSVVAGEAAFYPSAFPQRMIFKTFELTDEPFHLLQGCPTLAAFAKSCAEALAAQPWLSPFPVFLENVVPVFHQKKFVLVDSERRQLPTSAGEELGWKMAAMSGGRPMHVFGQWDGEVFMPLGAVVDGEFRPLHLPEVERFEW